MICNGVVTKSVTAFFPLKLPLFTILFFKFSILCYKVTLLKYKKEIGKGEELAMLAPYPIKNTDTHQAFW